MFMKHVLVGSFRSFSSSQDQAHCILTATCTQVMEEGERLSIKQSSMEGTIKKLRQQLRDLEAAQTQSSAKLAAEESRVETALKARQQAEASLAASVQQHKAEGEQQKQHYEALVARARTLQVWPALLALNPMLSLNGLLLVFCQGTFHCHHISLTRIKYCSTGGQ